MGEIDTKPIEPVQLALTFFEEKSDQKKHRSCTPSNSNCDEMDKGKDIENLHKDLANFKVQVEAKDAAYLQLLHKLEHSQKTTRELSAQLNDSEVERDVYFKEYKEARIRVGELEAKVKEMADQVLENGKIREQLSHVLCELKAVQREVLRMETELAAAREEKLKALTQAEEVETAAKMEKERTEELLKHVSKLSQAICMSKESALESEKEIKLNLKEEHQVQKLAEEKRKQKEIEQELEIKLLSKSEFIDSLQIELNQANELLSSSDKVVSDVINDMNKLKEDLEDKERENSDQAVYIGLLESEMNRLKQELTNANDEVTHLNSSVQMLEDQLEKKTTEMEEIKEMENEAQVEIALLKAEVHKVRSRLAAAEAVEARGGKVQPRSYQQPPVEHDPDEFFQANESLTAEAENERDENDHKIMISVDAYRSLIKKAEKSNQYSTSERKHEPEIMKRELEAALAKVAEFRMRAEQAVTRAEAAERAKLLVEDQLRKFRERKQKRRAALAALREESLPREFRSSSYDNAPTNLQPLFKVLNMKL